MNKPYAFTQVCKSPRYTWSSGAGPAGIIPPPYKFSVHTTGYGILFPVLYQMSTWLSLGVIIQADWHGFTATPDCTEKAYPDSHICCPIPRHSKNSLSEFCTHQKGTRESLKIPDEECIQDMFSGIWTGLI